MTQPNQSELDELDRLIIENQSEDGSIDISDQRSMRDEIVAYITANYTPNSEVDEVKAKAYQKGYIDGGIAELTKE